MVNTCNRCFKLFTDADRKMYPDPPYKLWYCIQCCKDNRNGKFRLISRRGPAPYGDVIRESG